MTLPLRRGEGERFTDELTYDFADLEHGLCGLAGIAIHPTPGRAGAAAALLAGGEQIAAVTRGGLELEVPNDWASIDAGGVRIADDGERARVSFEHEGAAFEIEVARLGGVALGPGSEFTETSGLTVEASLARVRGEARRGDSRWHVQCLGRAARTVGEPRWERLELLRSVVAVLDDGALLAFASARPAGAKGHGDEATSAVLLDGEVPPVELSEPLLSTEYDPEGRHRRATLELHPDNDSPLRAAGSRIAGVSLELGPLRLETAFLRFSMDERPGTARYDVLRRA